MRECSLTVLRCKLKRLQGAQTTRALGARNLLRVKFSGPPLYGNLIYYVEQFQTCALALRPSDFAKVQQHYGGVTGINNAAAVKVAKCGVLFAVIQQQNAEVAGVNNAA